MKMQNIIKLFRKFAAAISGMYHQKLLPAVKALRQSEWYQKLKDSQYRDKVFSRIETWLHSRMEKSLVCHGLLDLVLLLRRLHGAQNLLSLRNLLLLAMVGLYIIRSGDIMPDSIPFIGWLDDLVLIVYALRYIAGKAKTVTESK